MAYHIALIPGDGIGQEVVPEAVRVMDVLSGQHARVAARLSLDRPEPLPTQWH